MLTGNLLFISGQIPLNPKTSELVSGSVELETTQVMQNLKAILEEAGLNFNNVIKSSIFLTDMNDFSQINEVYARYFDEKTAPARETVEVSNLPKFVNIEISMIAVVG